MKKNNFIIIILLLTGCTTLPLNDADDNTESLNKWSSLLWKWRQFTTGLQKINENYIAPTTEKITNTLSDWSTRAAVALHLSKKTEPEAPNAQTAYDEIVKEYYDRAAHTMPNTPDYKDEMNNIKILIMKKLEN